MPGTDSLLTSPDQRPGLVTPLGERLAGDRLLLALFGDDEDSGEVDEDPCAAEQREDEKPSR